MQSFVVFLLYSCNKREKRVDKGEGMLYNMPISSRAKSPEKEVPYAAVCYANVHAYEFLLVLFVLRCLTGVC